MKGVTKTNKKGAASEEVGMGGADNTLDGEKLPLAASSDAAAAGFVPVNGAKKRDNKKAGKKAAPIVIPRPITRNPPHGYDYSHYLASGAWARAKAAELDEPSKHNHSLRCGDTLIRRIVSRSRYPKVPRPPGQ